MGTGIARLLQTRQRAQDARQLACELAVARARSAPGTKPEAPGFGRAGDARARGRSAPADASGAAGRVSGPGGRFGLVLCRLSLRRCVFIARCLLVFNGIRCVCTA